MGIKVYTKAEVDDYLALLTVQINGLTDALSKGLDVGFNKADTIQIIEASKRIIEQEAEIGGDVLKILDDCGDTSTITDWNEANDGLNPVENQVYIKQGAHSMALGVDADKIGEDHAEWDNSQSLGDLSEYQHDWIYMWVYFSTLDYLSSTGLPFIFYIGSDSSNIIFCGFAKTDLSVGWNLLKFDLDNPTGTTGTINWAAVHWQRLRVGEVTGNTHDFTIYVDSIMFVSPF